MKRLRFEVRKCRGGWGFFAQRRAEPISKDRFKRRVVGWAAIDLERTWLRLAIRSELVIKSRDGRIQDTRTYGGDPRRTRG